MLDGNGNLIAGAVFNGYTGFDINLTAYGKNCGRPGFLRAVLRYVFDQLKCLHVSAKTRRSNTHVQSLMRRSGFKFKCILEQHYGPNRDDDAVYFRLSKDDAQRFLNGRS